MTKTAKNKQILIRPPSKVGQKVLLKNFLEGYDYLWWINRAASLDLTISQPEFCEKIETTTKSFLGENGPPVSTERLVNSAKLEMHCTAYHSIESLLGLLFAFIIDPSYPWVWLTKYSFDEFNKLVSRLAKDGFSMFTSNEEQMAKALFFNSIEPKLQKTIDNSAKFAVDYLKALAHEFQDRADYNSYKHGLRTLAPQEFKVQLEQVKWAELTTTYLVIEKPVKWNNQLVSDLQVVFRAIDCERSKRIIITNTHLMHNLFEIKKALTYGETTQRTLCFFEHEKAYDILKPSKEGNVMEQMMISPWTATAPKPKD